MEVIIHSISLFIQFFTNYMKDPFQDPFSLMREVILDSMDSQNETSIHYVQDVNYIQVWEFEKSLDLNIWREWFHGNFAIGGYISLLYMVSVPLGMLIMKDRKPFNLRDELVIWNVLLALFSALGFIRCLPEMIYILKQENGFHSSICGR